jgi:hypothetical protein
MLLSEAGGKMIHEKNQKQKISWHCPLNGGLMKICYLKAILNQVSVKKQF